jgi:hypothetical protein
MVSVTGNRKLLRMTLPVFDESADEEYHSVHRRMNFMVDAEGSGNGRLERSDAIVVDDDQDAVETGGGR